MAQMLKDSMKTIPIVAIENDPITTGLVGSLSRPGGNLTGGITDAGVYVWEKRFELLREVAPAASIVAYASTQEGWQSSYTQAVREAAIGAGLSLRLAELNFPLNAEEYRRAFAAIRDQCVDALAIFTSASNFTHRQLMVSLVAELRLPAVYAIREFVDLGGLMAYAVDYAELFRY